jgi:hypothetical protein
MLGVLTKRALHGDPERFLLNRDVDPQLTKRVVEASVEAGDRQAARDRERMGATVPGLHDESIVEEIEHDLELGSLVVKTTRREAANVDVERRVPPMVTRRGRREPHLPEDLAVEVERVLRRSPVREVELWERHDDSSTKATSST